MCSASSLTHRVLTRQFPAHRCHRLAHGRTRHPHADGDRGQAAVLDYLPARKATTIDPMRAFGDLCRRGLCQPSFVWPTMHSKSG